MRCKFLTILALLIGANAGAQEVYYNEAQQNFFVSAGLGIKRLSEPDFEKYGNPWNPVAEISVGKWFTPGLGFKLSLEGSHLESYTSENRFKVYQYPQGSGVYYDKLYALGVYGDVLWNVFNTFGGYKDRFWALSPYARFGVIQSFTGNSVVRHEYSAGIGLYNTFRITDRIDLYLDIRQNYAPGRVIGRQIPGPYYETMISAGVACDLGKNYWDEKKPEDKKDTTNFADHTFVSVSNGGVMTFESGQQSGRPDFSSAWKISLGKWFSPYFGIRASYQAGAFQELVSAQRPGHTETTENTKGPYLLREDFGYIHADVLWNLFNTFMGYSGNRKVDVSAYVGGGLLSNYNIVGENITNELSADVGLLTDVKLDDRINAFADLQFNVMKSNSFGKSQGYAFAFIPQIGLSYNIKGNSWNTRAEALTDKNTAPDDPDQKYLIGKFGDNWFVSTAAGVTMLTEAGQNVSFQGGFSPALEIAVGKWFSPRVGGRLGIQGTSLSEWVDYRQRFTYLDSKTIEGVSKYRGLNKYLFVHYDFLWNFHNTAFGYKADRVWNLVPYVQFGVMQTLTKDWTPNRREYAAGAGILNDFRIGKRASAFIDIRSQFPMGRSVSSKQTLANMQTATVGLSYKIGNPEFDKAGSREGHEDSKKFFDNSFLSIGPGLTALWEGSESPRAAASWDINFGKWLSPQFGFRVGYQSGDYQQQLHEPRPVIGDISVTGENRDNYISRFTFGYSHLDILWNLSNTFTPYNSKQIFNVSPYVHMGIVNAYSLNGANYSNEYSAGLGALLTWKLDNRMSAFADIKMHFMKGNQIGLSRGYVYAVTPQVGLLYHFSGNDFDKSDYPVLKWEKQEKKPIDNYVAGKFFDNWFVSTSAGVSVTGESSDGTLAGVNPSMEIAIGKWFSPSFGARLEFQGATVSQWIAEERYHYTTNATNIIDGQTYRKAEMQYVFAHIDFMWNMHNSLWGYNPDRVWSLVPYTKFGIGQNLSLNGVPVRKEYAAGVGLINNFRLGKRSSIFVDLNSLFPVGRSLKSSQNFAYRHNASIGFAYDLGNPEWRLAGDDKNDVRLGKFTSNTFVTISGGPGTMFEDYPDFEGGRMTSSLEVAIGKWFSPHFGGRVGIQRGSFADWQTVGRNHPTTSYISGVDRYETDFQYTFTHADLLWNASNTFLGVNEERLWSFVPYLNVGILYNGVRPEYASAVGLLNYINLDEKVNAFIDARLDVMKSNTVGVSKGYAYGVEALLGLSYKLGDGNWHKVGEKEREEYFSRGRYAFTANLTDLTLGIGTLNLEFQYALGRHWTIDSQVKYNGWTLNEGLSGQKQNQQRTFAIGAKYWPWYTYSGWWLRGIAQAQKYRQGGCFYQRGYHDGEAFGLGVSGGFTIMLSRWINLDLGVGVWGGVKDQLDYSDNSFSKCIGGGVVPFFGLNEATVGITVVL